MISLIFDTETQGLPPRGSDYKTDYAKYPFIASIAWQVYDNDKFLYEQYNYIKPDGWEMSPGAAKVNGLTTEMLLEKGMDALCVLRHFVVDCQKADRIVAHNINFDMPIVKANLLKLGTPLESITEQLHIDKRYDTMIEAMTPMGVSKWPKLIEAYQHFFNEGFEGAHDALGDVKATYRLYNKLINL